MLTWQAKIEGRLRLATEQAKLNTASRMGESELEWMAVTPGGMNVCHSTFFLPVWGGKKHAKGG